jgi:hypothetical protein
LLVTTLSVLTESDRHFVKLLIVGLDAHEPWPEKRVGRPETARALTYIVHNRVSGLDVDRMDYLVRDALAVLGATHTLDVMRIVHASRILYSQPARQSTYLAIDESAASAVAQVFSVRMRLHRQVYQHRAVLVAAAHLRALLRAVDQDAPVGERMIDTIDDPVRFARWTDATVLGTCDLGTNGRAARVVLLRRPWARRVPAIVELRTRPSCNHCNNETNILDMFCGACGHGTDDRAGVTAAGGLLVTPQCVLTDELTSQAMRRALRRDDVCVYIADVSCGTSIGACDRHGRVWREYTARRAVQFCTAEGLLTFSTLTVMDAEYGHVRTAYCYLSADASDFDLSRAAAHFLQLGFKWNRATTVEYNKTNTHDERNK